MGASAVWPGGAVQQSTADLHWHPLLAIAPSCHAVTFLGQR